ncbi:MAG: hypothetical protein PF542_06410 [Nanoarchaeota archaeon]|jgi:H+/Cl- antiporter ClcA|nr:hypothetical protein [Nanoarchaeota archaeon]
MRFKINRVQSLILVLGSLAGAYVGYFNRTIHYCIQTPCPSPSPMPKIIVWAIIFGVVIYILELIYNNLIKKK